MEKQSIIAIYNNDRGVSAILIAVLMPVFIGLAALVLDLGHMYVARNELQNAADAAALAGARFLYNDDGTAINDGSDGSDSANQIAFNAAVANLSDKIPAEMWYRGVVYANVGDPPYPNQQADDDQYEPNAVDILRGHWSFATGKFTASNSLSPVDLWDVSTEELDAMDGSDGNPPFINAVYVRTRREASPLLTWFARIWPDWDALKVTASAVAYIGFAADMEVMKLDQPIAICEDSIKDPETDNYSCNIGRMINSGQSIESNETGGWTSFNQEDPCSGGTNAPEVRGLVCGNDLPDFLYFGKSMATIGGEVQSAFADLIECWEGKRGDPPQPWGLTLPVITCPGNNVGTCETVKGYVVLNVVWITGAGEDPSYNDAPNQMGAWNFSDYSYDHNSDGVIDGKDRWESFVSKSEGFNLQNVDGSPAPYSKKSIYFRPSCEYHEPNGTTGGENFGVLARIPKLVQ